MEKNTRYCLLFSSLAVVLIFLFLLQGGSIGGPEGKVLSGAEPLDVDAQTRKILKHLTPGITAAPALAGDSSSSDVDITSLPVNFPLVNKLWYSNRKEIDGAFREAASKSEHQLHVGEPDAATFGGANSSGRLLLATLPPFPGEFPSYCFGGSDEAAALLSTWVRQRVRFGNSSSNNNKYHNDHRNQREKRKWTIVDAGGADNGYFISAVLDAFGAGRAARGRDMSKELLKAARKGSRDDSIPASARYRYCGSACSCTRGLSLSRFEREMRQASVGHVSLHSLSSSKFHVNFLNSFYSGIAGTPAEVESGDSRKDEKDDGNETQQFQETTQRQQQQREQPVKKRETGVADGAFTLSAKLVGEKQRQKCNSVGDCEGGSLSMSAVEVLIPASVTRIDVLRVAPSLVSSDIAEKSPRFLSKGAASLVILEGVPEEQQQQQQQLGKKNSDNAAAADNIAAAALSLIKTGKYKCYLPIVPSHGGWWNTAVLSRRLAPWRESFAKFPLRAAIVCSTWQDDDENAESLDAAIARYSHLDDSLFGALSRERSFYEKCDFRKVVRSAVLSKGEVGDKAYNWMMEGAPREMRGGVDGLVVGRQVLMRGRVGGSRYVKERTVRKERSAGQRGPSVERFKKRVRQ